MGFRQSITPALLAALLLNACNDGSFSGGASRATTEKKPEPEKEETAAEPLGKSKEGEAVPRSISTPVPTNTNPTSVTKGSFTARAEPPNPGRLQNYRIIIDIKLPPGTTNYPLTDLSGFLSGTDGYTQRIPESYGGCDAQSFGQPNFSVSGNIATISLCVPGASIPSTRDTVDIRSTLLNEHQDLSIQFQQ